MWCWCWWLECTSAWSLCPTSNTFRSSSMQMRQYQLTIGRRWGKLVSLQVISAVHSGAHDNYLLPSKISLQWERQLPLPEEWHRSAGLGRIQTHPGLCLFGLPRHDDDLPDMSFSGVHGGASIHSEGWLLLSDLNACCVFPTSFPLLDPPSNRSIWHSFSI